MTGPISYGNYRHVSGGETSTDFDFHAGKVAIRLIPENAVGNDISKCVNIRDTGNGALYPIATATPPQEYVLSLSDGISVQEGLSAVYSKDQFGKVVVHGNLVGQMQNTSVIATLPAGFRPVYTLEMPATCDFTAGRIQVNNAEEIRVISQLSECSSLYFLAVFVAGV